MTVVVYRDGIMAADTEISESYIRTGRVEKLMRVKRGGPVMGFCGDLASAVAFMRWAKDGFPAKKRPQGMDDLRVMIADKNGEVAFIEGNGPLMIVGGEYFAIGSGQDVALGALAMGASAEEAAKIACKFVHGCSEPVTTIKV